MLKVFDLAGTGDGLTANSKSQPSNMNPFSSKKSPTGISVTCTKLWELGITANKFFFRILKLKADVLPIYIKMAGAQRTTFITF